MAWTTPVVPVAATLITSAWGTTSVVDNLSYLYAQQGIFPSQVRRNAPINATIAAATNDWNPAGLSTCNRIRLDVTGGSQSITGIVAQTANTEILLQNINTGANDAILKSASASSSSSNRFVIPGGADINIRPNGGMLLILYDGTLLKWVALQI